MVTLDGTLIFMSIGQRIVIQIKEQSTLGKLLLPLMDELTIITLKMILGGSLLVLPL